MSPAVGTASAAGVARFSRFTYNDSTTTSDAAKFQFMDLGYGSSATSQAAVRSLIASIHSSDPGTRILLYKTTNVSSTDPNAIGGCVGWNSSKPYGGIPLSWFLLTPSGTPLMSSYGNYELDPGNANVQQACINSAISLAKTGGFDGTFWDMMSTSRHAAGFTHNNCVSTDCYSNTNWHSAMTSFITNVTSALHAQGLLAIGNISGGAETCCAGGPTWWDNYLSAGLDGAMEESFTSGTNGLPVPTTQWQLELGNEAWNEAHGKYLLANADVGSNQALNVYGLATVLLAAQGDSSWDASSGSYGSNEYWFSQYTTAQNLGSPLAPYTVQSNGLYVRKFQNGSVVVNPTTSSITDPVLGTVGPQSGMIL